MAADVDAIAFIADRPGDPAHVLAFFQNERQYGCPFEQFGGSGQTRRASPDDDCRPARVIWPGRVHLIEENHLRANTTPGFRLTVRQFDPILRDDAADGSWDRNGIVFEVLGRDRHAWFEFK